VKTRESRPGPKPVVTWLVSTRHWVRCVADDGPVERPYGVKHAREPGRGLSACGEFAVDWRIFWGMNFTSEDPDACPACRAVVNKVQTRQSA
jgi:hypothetical protein